MNTSKYLVAIFLAPLAPFVLYFSKHQASFSNNQVDWGAFGSYMGGVSGPIVAAITLIFLVDSYQRSSKQAALQTLINGLIAHVDYATNYKTSDSGAYSGHKYLGIVWKSISNAEEANLFDRINQNYVQFQPLINNIQLLISIVDQDTSFCASEKNHYIQHIYSRLTSVELKLFLASSLIDPKSKKVLHCYNYTSDRVIEESDSEDWILTKFAVHIKTNKKMN